MKILYDHQAFTIQKIGGVSRYFSSLIKWLKQNQNISVELSFIYSDNEYLRLEKQKKQRNIIYTSKKSFFEFLRKNFRKYRLILRAYDYLKDKVNKKYSLVKITSTNYDIFHPTYYDPYFLSVLKNKPFVLTIHDMIHELFPFYFSEDKKTTVRKKILAEKAKLIIAVSQNTKNDIVKILGIPEEKIIVVHHANFLDIKNEEEIYLPRRYLLYVGGRKRYKNFLFFIESIAPILRNEKDLFVVCFGGDRFDLEERNFFNSLYINEKLMQINGNDDKLVYAYKHALGFVYPSLYEGFGIPILEAFANGCPVALSNTSCFPEIAGDAGIYFNSMNKESIYENISQLISDKELQLDLKKKGLARLRFFSLEKMSKETLNVYKKAVQ